MAGPVEGARTFSAAGDDYDRWMGRYSRELASPFAAAVTLDPGATVLDVGCGPGALTAELVRLVGADRVSAVDPAPGFVAACRESHPGVDVRLGTAEQTGFDDGAFDAVFAQLVLSFVSDAAATAREFQRVLRPGGVAAACVWDFTGGMRLLRTFWDAALEIDADAPDEALVTRFGAPGEIADLFERSGFADVTEQTIQVSTTYRDYDELWGTLLLGIGPAGAYTASLAPEPRERLREVLFRRLGSPEGAFRVAAAAHAGFGRAAS